VEMAAVTSSPPASAPPASPRRSTRARAASSSGLQTRLRHSKGQAQAMCGFPSTQQSNGPSRAPPPLPGVHLLDLCHVPHKSHHQLLRSTPPPKEAQLPRSCQRTHLVVCKLSHASSQRPIRRLATGSAPRCKPEPQLTGESRRSSALVGNRPQVCLHRHHPRRDARTMQPSN